ncbi:hypothetical protein M0208_14345 [Sphingomonas sp. SUN019]|uniref:hypothetical protein n=1 Tax=Sphingomonas sp. SUN019 TaxID=2937788 RepID=UPI002164BEC6|nr:hypothetical protein [Sphingomonas sp. SUN019]UVO51627.1 hypothetical protein M0208_14345 [Sphingomonas sp. SUN019]
MEDQDGMATLAPVRAAPIGAEDRFFGGMALAMVAITFVGFAPSYYFMRFTAAPALLPIVHLHGLVFTGWILLHAGQTGLVVSRRIDLHRRIGVFGAVLAVAVVVLGFITALVTAPLHGLPGHRAPPIIFPFMAVSTFGILCAAGVAWRRKPQHHKRIMLLATSALIITPGARIGRMVGTELPPPVFGMLLTDVLLAALVIFDVRTRGRLHPATIAAGGLFLATQPLRVAVSHWPAWQAFAASIGAR